MLVADGDPQPRLLFGADHGVGILDRAGGRLLDQDVAAGLEAGDRHRPVQVDAGGYGDEVDLLTLLRQHLPQAVVHGDAALAQGGDVGGEGPVVEGRGDLGDLPNGSLPVELARPGAVVRGEPPHADDGNPGNRHGFISSRKPGIANGNPGARKFGKPIPIRPPRSCPALSPEEPLVAHGLAVVLGDRAVARPARVRTTGAVPAIPGVAAPQFRGRLGAVMADTVITHA